jgi:cytochrome c peroxidase
MVMTPFEKRGLALTASLVAACNLHVLDNRPPPTQVVDNGGVSENTASPDAIHLDASNPFFADFGTNRRTCGTCHHEDQGWTTTPAFVQTVEDGDALFAFDGSDCLPPGAPNPSAASNSTELRRFGNVRVELPVPSGADYALVASTDPLGCPTTPSAAGLRLYRRPLPAANSAFLATVMWDGRESQGASVTEDLQNQANDATRIHAQALTSLTVEARASVVAFETALFHARHTLADLDLTSGANGGPAFLFQEALPSFQVGINAPFEPGFTSVVFTLYQNWEIAAPTDLARSIGRGEVVFNMKTFTIDGVAGMNGTADPSSGPLRGTCGTCHNNPNIGNASSAIFLDLGITGLQPGGGLTVQHLPTYTFRDLEGGKTIAVTDPGRGLITGRFADLGKTKVPNLRGLTLRAPYFHNGSAAQLANVIDFYEQRFGIGFTAQERSDLLNFLAAL